jgi:uncharacterized membrane protein YhaH (DUF805 family)
MEWMLLPLKRYFDFEGRSRRTEYWMYTLMTVLLYLLCIALIVIGAVGSGDSGEMNPTAMAGVGLMGLLILGLLIPTIAVQVRRFHDQDKSGWWVLINLIPSIGGIIVLVFMCLEGTRGPNQYGPDPKG